MLLLHLGLHIKRGRVQVKSTYKANLTRWLLRNTFWLFNKCLHVLGNGFFQLPKGLLIKLIAIQNYFESSGEKTFEMYVLLLLFSTKVTAGLQKSTWGVLILLTNLELQLIASLLHHRIKAPKQQQKKSKELLVAWEKKSISLN